MKIPTSLFKNIISILVLTLVVLPIAPAVAQAEEVANPADATGPVISSVAESVTTTSATITWVTNEPAISRLEYGPTQNYGLSLPVSSTASINGSITLQSLASATLYYYCIHATDASGNISNSCGHHFTTLSTTPTSSSQDDGSSTPLSVRQEWLRSYRRQSSDLQQKIAALPSTPALSIPIPVLFGVGLANIWPNFGDPRPHRLHEGEDIMGVKGTPIVSPTAAVVTRTDYGAGEGNAVYTTNPGGETFVYYHLDRIGEGVVSGLVLEKGSLIGYLGNTGDAISTAPHLHFEIHSSSNTLVDPFPRLKEEFSVAEKVSYLSAILSKSTDSVGLSRLLVTNFRGTFTAALAANITLPLLITDALASIPASTIGAGTPRLLPTGDLDINSSGPLVIELQKYLIQAASGAAATRLAQAGATGNFGTLTKAALVEYQIKVGITPASGYYGSITRAFILAHPLSALPPPVVATPPSSDIGALARDLYLNMSGEDVRTLQKLLNNHGYAVAATGSGSPGNETIYFGAATKAAVIKFQIARAISPAAGYVGPVTRAALKAL